MQFDLRERLLALESRYSDSRFAPSEVTALVRSCIRDKNVRVNTKRSNRVDLEQVVPGGAYDSGDDTDGVACIHLDLHYHPDQQHLFLKDVYWDRVSFEICEVIGHEYVHRDQSRRRVRNNAYSGILSEDTATKQEQQYYGESHEVEAYGYSIAAELICYYNGNRDCAVLTQNYQLYNRLFAADQSVIIKLDQFISKYLDKLKAVQHVKQAARTTRRTRGSDQ